jgi:hypothetical protein
MLLTYLSAAVPLAKTLSFIASTDSYVMNAYPMVRKMTSSLEDVVGTEAFEESIKAHGLKGDALLFGALTRAIEDESRAALSDKDKLHEWVCFDFDKVPKPPTLEGALEAINDYLPACCHDVECVIQLSASCFDPRARQLSCHVFMRLAQPTQTKTLKDWLVSLNFSSPGLRALLSLTDSCNALKYKLDPSVADPARLIYIAPPTIKGFTPKVDAWLRAYAGASPALTLPSYAPVTRENLTAEINRQRDLIGLEPREYKMIKLRGELVLQQAEEAVMSDIKASGNHYMRFNLNGGDSYAYYIDLQKPEIIGNFKGEPFMQTKDVAPEFYKGLIKATQGMPSATATSDSLDILAFYATNRSSALYIGTYDRASDAMRVDKSSETAATAWLKQYGIPFRTSLPHHDLVYDISNDLRYEEGSPVINLYERTKLIKQYGNLERTTGLNPTMSALDEACPVIMKFLRSITGDPKSAASFVNWLAFIFQNRVKTGTAWLLWGTEGSGKGKFIEHVCGPLFGRDNVGQVLLSNVDQQFNALLEGKLLVNIDEAAMSRTRDKIESMSKLRNWITETNIVINEKHVGERTVPSFANFIISSNDYRPIAINTGDRRYHVATRQETRLLPTANEFAILTQGMELNAFAEHLGRLIVNEKMVREPVLNQQKMRLFEATHSLTDMVAVAILEGDASFFFEARPTSLALGTTGYSPLAPIKQYDDLLRAMLNNSFTVARHEYLYVLFSIVVNDTKFFPENATMQKQLFSRYGLSPTLRDEHLDKRTDTKVHGVRVGPWKPVPEFRRSIVSEKSADNTVVPMRHR